MDIVIIRNFNAFGPYQNDGSYGSVIARFAKAATSNEPLYVYGDGSAERDYMYIDDIIQAYEFAIKLPSGVYNFGTGKCYTIKEIAQKIKWIAESSSDIVHIAPRAGEVQRLCCDISKVKKYGFHPKTDFDRDLKKYMEWYING
jgi:nucleoside-diphosphate-sugar epimerase